ncbi:MAG: hypothetical protein H0T42_23980 [Deltaproteobacteria bacterium]|nr:hypothetical protein [Deltaproteobacteria bacterium]
MPARDFFARHGWLIAIAAAYLYVFPYFPKIRSANELPRVYLTQAMVSERSFAIDSGVERWGGTADVSPANGHLYSNKAPGSSMLAVPAYAAVRLVSDPSLALSLWICRVVAGILPMLGFVWLLWGFLARFAPDPAIRRLVLVAYALGSMAMTYSILFFSHQLGAICVGSAWILAVDVAERRRGLRAIAVAGALAGAAPLVDYQAVFAAVPVAVYVVARMWRTMTRAEMLRAIGIAAVAAAVPIGILLTYHAICFGSPWRTGYDASTTFAHLHQEGFLGITELRWEAFHGSLVRPDNGLVFLAPWLLIAIPGSVVLARGERGFAAVGIAVAVIYLLFISSINFWRGGWGVGPRYITAMLPFLLPAIAAQLQAWKGKPIVIGIAAGTIVTGVAIYSLANVTFPYWPDSVKNPLVEVAFRLLGDGLFGPNAGSALGLTSWFGALPYLVLIAGLLGWAIQRAAGWRALAISVVLGTLMLVGYAQLPTSAPAQSERVYKFVHGAMLER